MRIQRAHDQRELGLGQQRLQRRFALRQLLQLVAAERNGRRDYHAVQPLQQHKGFVARGLQQALRRDQHRLGPAPHHRNQLLQPGPRGLGVGDGDEDQIVLGQCFGRCRQRLARQQVQHGQRDVRMFKQERQRRIRHQVARPHDGQQAQSGAGAGRQFVLALGLQRLFQGGNAGTAQVLQLQHHGQVHQRVGVAGVGHGARQQGFTQRHQQLAFKGHAHQPRQAHQRGMDSLDGSQFGRGAHVHNGFPIRSGQTVLTLHGHQA